ncbi:MAG: DNA adenine methylase [Bacteroidaceae bacterium]|nr:DNA adenine methylase [Bacteroidaceae bacterium]
MIKSPLNYIGGKYKLLPQILPLFPREIDTFVDLFAGGLDVSINVEAKRVICNDINNYVIGLFEYIQHYPIDELIKNIHDVIEEYGLTKQNKEGYNALREEFNRTRSSLHLFLLVCYGFNHQFRFNGNGNFNNPFGINRSSYNANTEKNLRQLHEAIQGFEYHIGNFRGFDLEFMKPGDFLYADPPYLISCGSYNDGKRGFEGWSADDDQELFAKLDNLDLRNVSFALSNVVRHKGDVNEALQQWASNYNVHYLNASYSNSNYQATESETVEVLITNY